MTDGKSSLVQRLRGAKNPREIENWEDRDGYYVAACRVSAEDVPDLIDLVRKWADPDWLDDADESQDDQEVVQLLPVTAWRTLADLKANAAVQPLVDLLSALEDEFDDWAAEDLPHVFGKIGESAIQPLIDLATTESKPDFIRNIAVRGLRCVADYHPHTRACIVECLSEMMAHAVKEHVEFNTTLLVELVELRAVQAADSIERAFAGDLLDVGMMGNWEDVRRELEVQGLGLEMPANPYNSLEELRRPMGFGIFSDDPIFMSGDLRSEAERAYYGRADRAFSQSSEAGQVIERHGDLQWYQVLLQFGVEHFQETVDAMTLESVQGFIFDYVPRKVSTDADAASSIIGELRLFWQFLDRVYKLPAAPSIVEWLATDGLVAELKAELSDESNFGMAKSLFMQGKQAGFDMTSEAGLAEFMEAYNRSLPSPDTPAPDSGKRRVGRNEPCPCGSGKKYKKCCGRPS